MANAAVKQRQALPAEPRRVDDAVRAVRVEQQWRPALRLHHALVVHQADWHLQPHSTAVGARVSHLADMSQNPDN